MCILRCFRICVCLCVCSVILWWAVTSPLRFPSHASETCRWVSVYFLYFLWLRRNFVLLRHRAVTFCHASVWAGQWKSSFVFRTFCVKGLVSASCVQITVWECPVGFTTWVVRYLWCILASAGVLLLVETLMKLFKSLAWSMIHLNVFEIRITKIINRPLETKKTEVWTSFKPEISGKCYWIASLIYIYHKTSVCINQCVCFSFRKWRMFSWLNSFYTEHTYFCPFGKVIFKSLSYWVNRVRCEKFMTREKLKVHLLAFSGAFNHISWSQ